MLVLGGLLLGAPLAAWAQNAPFVIRTFYDSARTQPRSTYSAYHRVSSADTVAHGSFRRFWTNGSLAEVGHFTHGQADSTWSRFYPTQPGQPPRVARHLLMQGGKPDGAFVVWHPDGRVAQRGTYRNGQLVDSLVTLKPSGQPRLLGLFTESPTGGLQGSFRLWNNSYTAQALNHGWIPSPYSSYSNPYPARDPRRYWTGQLGAGRLTGAFTQRDADGQAIVRLSFTSQGRLRQVTRYYPAAWRHHELLQDFDDATRRDSIVPSAPFWQWEPVSRQQLFVLRRWSPEGGEPVTTMMQLKPVKQRPQPVRTAPPLRHPPAPNTRPVACQGPQKQLHKDHSLQLQPGPRHTRWMLGEADTTGATHRPLRHREKRLSDGRRVLATKRSTRTYYPDGKLQLVEHQRWLGRELERGYFSNGQRQDVMRQGLLASYERVWQEDGRSSGTEFSRLLGVRMVQVRVRKHQGRRTYSYKTRPRLWESKKRRRNRHPH
ncbi:hypothetical protein KBK19_04300 [Microvirga sp. STR05]|uniref:Toxin-antitoxin system YwqK family antitoxin n=1 Tax=Hymenobacter duratus TaxID=2771356 RepID=A0ABR8JEU6_9BACT|nr:hypothetical protein [Hymenobacter duratus]MBD2714251.1 hypothetical protein [Hymenobacter duratus]MBR7949153.1 hypothetical protein [Microvirga sp. STR05]